MKKYEKPTAELVALQLEEEIASPISPITPSIDIGEYPGPGGGELGEELGG